MELVLLNGKVYQNKGQYAEAIYAKDGVICKVGTTAEISGLAGKDAEVIDLGGKTVLPGFNDSHQHLFGLGESLLMVKLHGVTSLEKCIELGKEFIAKNNVPAGELVLGRGWNQDLFTDTGRMINRYDLDKISTEHPIIYTRACGHAATCNSKALEMAGMTKDTPQVPGGEFYFGEDGELNGIFSELAKNLLLCLYPEQSKEYRMKAIEAAMKYASSLGITSIQTNDLKELNYEEMFDAYQTLLDEGKSKLRVYHQFTFNDLGKFEKAIGDGYVTGRGCDWHRIGPLKLFVDGSLGARTALMRAPYADDPSTKGIECLTVEQLDGLVQMANKHNTSVTIHAIGDGAIDMVLTAYEKVIVDGFNPLRHGVVHSQITDIPMLERYKKSDVLSFVQPIFIDYDSKIVADRVGKELASTSYTFGTSIRMGIHTSYGTDAPVEDCHTFNNLYCAVTRKCLNGTPEGGYYPEEKVDVETAVDAYTLESAYASFDECRKGRLMPGYFADMVVLDRDIFTINPDEIKDLKAEMTFVGGKLTYKKA